MDTQQQQPVQQQNHNNGQPKLQLPNKMPVLLFGALVLFLVGMGVLASSLRMSSTIVKNKATAPSTGSCSWTQQPNAIGYHYTVVDNKTESVIKDDTTDKFHTAVSFVTQSGGSYTCTVDAIVEECNR